MPSPAPRLVRRLLVATGVLAVLNIASFALSGGGQPVAMVVFDIAVGVAMLGLLAPAWRGSTSARLAEIIGLVLAALSALPGVVAAPAALKAVPTAFTVVALAVAVGLLVVGRRSTTTAVRA